MPRVSDVAAVLKRNESDVSWQYTSQEPCLYALVYNM